MIPNLYRLWTNIYTNSFIEITLTRLLENLLLILPIICLKKKKIIIITLFKLIPIESIHENRDSTHSLGGYKSRDNSITIYMAIIVLNIIVILYSVRQKWQTLCRTYLRLHVFVLLRAYNITTDSNVKNISYIFNLFHAFIQNSK